MRVTYASMEMEALRVRATNPVATYCGPKLPLSCLLVFQGGLNLTVLTNAIASLGLVNDNFVIR